MDPKVFAALLKKIERLKSLTSDRLEQYDYGTVLYFEGKLDAYQSVINILRRDFADLLVESDK